MSEALIKAQGQIQDILNETPKEDHLALASAMVGAGITLMRSELGDSTVADMLRERLEMMGG